MKNFTSILALALVLSILIMPVTSLELENEYTLYIFGWRECPHCFDLAQYIVENNMTFKWYWIEERENAEGLRRLATSYEFSAGTPTVVVVVNGKAEAIVVGAVLEDRFWEKVINEPDGRLQVFIGQSLKSVKPSITEETLVENFFTGPEASFSEVVEYAGKERPFYILEYLPTIVLLLIISGVTVAFFWRRKG